MTGINSALKLRSLPPAYKPFFLYLYKYVKIVESISLCTYLVNIYLYLRNY